MDKSATIWHLIARVLNGEASSQEQQELTDLLNRDPSLLQQYDLLSRIWKERHGSNDSEDRETARFIISRIINKAENDDQLIEMPARRPWISRRKTWLAAASVLLLICTGWFWISNQQSAAVKPTAEAIEARKGSRSRSLLPDGTTVWLNAGSKLYYDDDFSGPTREVRLEGEAFFDVVKQPDRPFIVHTAGIDIKVLGTAFNVKSYAEDKTVETTLYRGAVKVFRSEESELKAIHLRPNEKLILPKELTTAPEATPEDQLQAPVKEISPRFTIAKIDSTKKESERFETAWIYSRLEFRGDSFEQLAKKLERWYNVSIFFNDEKAKQLNFNGSFENETVSEAFAALKLAVPFSYSIKGHDIYIESTD